MEAGLLAASLWEPEGPQEVAAPHVSLHTGLSWSLVLGQPLGPGVGTSTQARAILTRASRTQSCPPGLSEEDRMLFRVIP